MYAGALFGTLATAIYASQQAARAAWGSLGASVLILAVLWATALSRRFSAEVRSWLVLGVLYAASTLALITTGLSAETMLGLAGLVSVASLLLGEQRGRWALGLALLTVAGGALAYGSGSLAIAVPSPVAANNPWNWVRSSLFVAAIITGVGGGASFLLRELIRALVDRMELIEKLREEARDRERTHAQLAETQQRLLHAHKLEVVGRLAGGIAHDFNNTLTVILSYSELVKTRLGRDHPVSELADQIVQAAEQGGDLTKQLLTFSRRQMVKPRTVDVQQTLRNIERALTRLVPRSIQVHRTASSEELYVTIDPTQLQQAILNLALNARDAMPKGGDLYLEASPLELREPGSLPLIPGQYVTIRVRDTGTGMSPETLSRLFEPFFTTKEPGLGTGLGLSNVRETTEAAGGHVAVKSELGQGSELTVYLPRADPHISGVQTMEPTPVVRHQTVLVVDDEPQIREVMRTMLVDSHYAVRVAESGPAALEVLRNEQVDLVCTDLVMPEMSGTKLSDEVKQLHAQLPVVICSAYGADEDVSRRVASGEVRFLAKPFTRKELLDVVERALAPKPGERPRVAG